MGDYLVKDDMKSSDELKTKLDKLLVDHKPEPPPAAPGHSGVLRDDRC